MLLGIIAGLTTCALWGMTFVAPRAITPFTAWDLTIARYSIFGLACVLLMVDRRFRQTGIAPSRLLIGCSVERDMSGISCVPPLPYNWQVPPYRPSS